jgi:hypothetical protein
LHSTAPFVPDASVISSGFTGWSNTVLSASVDPDSLPTTAWFVWGPGTNLNNTTSAMDLGNGADPVQMSFPLAGLAPATKYTFRVAASNLGGGILGNTAFMMTTWATLPPLPVTNSTDNPGDPQSLPGEILLAPPNSKLVVPTLLTGTLLLTNGPLPIAPNLVIEGNCNFVIDGNGSNQAFVPITTTIQVSGVTFSNCTGIDGGAIYIASTGTFIASNCTFVANSASASGGGIYVASGGTLELRQCTFLLNQAGYGGAVDAYGDAALYNCTIATNIVSFSGGGVHVESGGTASLSSCTLAGNFAFEGGGIEDDAGGGALSLQNSIVAHNIAGAGGGPDVANPVPGFASSGYNLISRDDGSTGWRHNGLKDDDMLGTSGSPAYPLLSRLDNFGGCTATMELLPGSPAIDAGLSGGLAFDQRGYMRSNNVLGKLTVPGDYSDIGAFEVQSIDITNAPTLIIFRSGTNNAIVLWDAKAKAYTLDYTQDLKPAPPWSPVPSTPVLTNGGTQLTVTRSFLQTKEFYRLRAP